MSPSQSGGSLWSLIPSTCVGESGREGDGKPRRRSEAGNMASRPKRRAVGREASQPLDARALRREEAEEDEVEEEDDEDSDEEEGDDDEVVDEVRRARSPRGLYLGEKNFLSKSCGRASRREHRLPCACGSVSGTVG